MRSDVSARFGEGFGSAFVTASPPRRSFVGSSRIVSAIAADVVRCKEPPPVTQPVNAPARRAMVRLLDLPESSVAPAFASGRDTNAPGLSTATWTPKMKARHSRKKPAATTTARRSEEGSNTNIAATTTTAAVVARFVPL